MATYYSQENGGLALTPVVKPAATLGVNANVRRFRGALLLAGQVITDNWQITTMSAGCLFCYGVMTSTVTLGTSTLAVGVSGAAGKYAAAAVFTTPNVPTLFGNALAVGQQTPFAADEVVLGTVAAASLPGAGTLVVDMYASNG
jgi:hypothetical protein